MGLQWTCNPAQLSSYVAYVATEVGTNFFVRKLFCSKMTGKMIPLPSVVVLRNVVAPGDRDC